MKITIIGAGPIGCYAGYLFSKNGHQVTIYEEHSTIGSPIQCTGLLTKDFDNFNLKKDSFLINTFSKIQVFSPANKNFNINQKEYLICRNKFDNFFANLAKKQGAKILTNHSFQRKENNYLIIKDTLNNQELKVESDLVIASDGPISKTAKAYNFYHKDRKHFFGIQATVEGNFNEKEFKTYFGKSICPGLFAWVVPESKTIARVGLATTSNSKKYFDKFLEQNNFKPINIQAGTIPLYNPKQKLFKDNCYVLGDAAGFVKATTLGGLNPGLWQAQILVNCIQNNKNYLREVKKITNRLKLHLRIKNIIDKFSDKDWDYLIKLISQDKIKSILEIHTRENPLPILIKSILKEPRFFKFVKYIFKR